MKLESAVPEEAPRFDGDLSKPLIAVVSSQDPVLTSGDWQWVRLRLDVPVTADASPAQMWSMLTGGGLALLRYRCDHDEFVADLLVPVG